MDRRNFLKMAGTMMAGLNVVPALANGGQGTTVRTLTTQRSFASGKYALEIEKLPMGWLHGTDGGSAYSEVVNEKVGPDHVIHKHLAGVKYEDVMVTCGTGMSKAFYEWINASM